MIEAVDAKATFYQQTTGSGEYYESLYGPHFFRKHHLLDAALQLHMIANGSMTCEPSYAQELLDFIEMRLIAWFEQGLSKDFDDKVRRLCREAVREYRTLGPVIG